ncbi:class I SAM-dependent methyltransferase [Agromyces archimandritae]|uniref:Class I SAM-dependent methyltransferase n=2 Tax=Agromyces archimandritae TaxID=2781962 RepID=A0A975IQ61_9MICO|nr:class I SAM-dependent methyltransferase [Agromyces archimandritae]
MGANETGAGETGAGEAGVVDAAGDAPDLRHALSFAAAADAYAKARPSYPVEAVAWLVGDAERILDLGAGTGKLTQALVALDRDVVAVDPIEEMLDELSIAVPGVPRILGTAEDIPLDDEDVDAVVAGQAWHWFDRRRATAEIARVLRPGGVLGLVWNSRDGSVDWMRRAGEIMHERHDAAADLEGYVRIGAPFGPVAEHVVRWTDRMSRARFLDLVRSRSYYLTATPADQAATIAALEELLATHPEVRDVEELEVPYVTRCFRAEPGE